MPRATSSTTELSLSPIAYIRTGFTEKFGLPRQGGLAPAVRGEIVFVPEYSRSDAVRGLTAFSHIWLIWGFSLNNPDSAAASKVRPPRLGGNEKVGVYATRSPYRPNPIGLSSVRIAGISAAAGRIEVLGADLVDGTPVFDVKPYIEYADSHPGVRSGRLSEEKRAEAVGRCSVK